MIYDGNSVCTCLPMKNSELQDLFVEYYPALKSFAVRYVGAAEVAEDLVQDVFLRLWENIHKSCMTA